MHNYIEYISGGKSHAIIDAHNAIQSIADKVDLFVHSGEGFCVLLALYAITSGVMLLLIYAAKEDSKFWSERAGSMFDGLGPASFIEYIKENGYVRNKHGVMQRIDDWMENGSRKPKRKGKVKAEQPKGSMFIEVRQAKLPEVINDRIPDVFRKPEPKTMTRAEACLAILHEAKEAGFPWAQSAIEQMRKDNISGAYVFNIMSPLRDAVVMFNSWSLTREGLEYWFEIACSEEVKSFKPKTQWPA